MCPFLSVFVLLSLAHLHELQTTHKFSYLNPIPNIQGGFCGGPGQLPHLAPTYAAVNALMAIGTEEAYQLIDRPKLYQFLLARKSPDGGDSSYDHAYPNSNSTS